MLDYQTILKSEPAKKYIEACKKLKGYYMMQHEEMSCDVSYQRYREAIEEYRYFLEANGIKMPTPKYPYEKDNKATHKFLDITFTKSLATGEVKKVHSVLNPNYIYFKR